MSLHQTTPDRRMAWVSDAPFPLANSALVSLPWRQRQALVRDLFGQ